MIFAKKPIGGFTPPARTMSGSSTFAAKSNLGRFWYVEAGIAGDKFSLLVLVVSGISIVLQGLLILINLKKFPPELPIFYSQPWGEKILAQPLFLLVLPLTVLVFVILNYWILLMTRENIFLRRIITTFTLLVSFFCTYSLLKIISLLI